MKMTFLLLSGWFFAVILSTPALAQIIQEQVTPAYVRGHPKEWSVEVTKDEDGLIHFTVKHDVGTPKYHIARLAVYHQRKLIATSDTPSIGKKNICYFSLTAEDMDGSKFDLSDGTLGSGDISLPEVGFTLILHFRLLDFVPEQMLKSAPGGAATPPP